MPNTPDVGFGFGVEGDAPLLQVITQLRQELKNLKGQQDEVKSSAEGLQRAWQGLIQLAAAFKLAEFARDVYTTAVNIGKLSQITGVSTNTLSVYYKAATDVGVAYESIDKAVTKLSRSLVMLQADNLQAAQGFGLLHLSAKDFIGLSPDEKLKKVADAFGRLKDSTEKGAAAQMLFGRGAAQMIPVLDQLAGKGFKEVADQAERLGLVFDKQMTQAALRAQASLADMTGMAEGATAQFETGLLPALADVADALVHQISGKGVNGFRTLGTYAGVVLKVIITGFTELGLYEAAAAATLIDAFGFAWDELKNGATTVFTALKQAMSGDFSGALNTLRTGANASVNIAIDETNRLKAIWKERSDARKKAYEDIYHPKDRKLPKPGGDQDAGDITKPTHPNTGAIKQQTNDELALYRALAQQRAEIDKASYDQGLISLQSYFDQRRGSILQEFTEEVKALGAEKLGLEQALAQAKTQEDIARIKQQIAHVDQEAGLAAVKRDTDLGKNDRDRQSAQDAHNLKLLEVQEKLAQMEGDRTRVLQLQNQIQDAQLRKELEQLGWAKQQIDEFLAAFGRARSIQSAGSEAQKGFEGGTAQLAAKKGEIEDKAAGAGGIPKYEAERQLAAAYAAQIPLLQQKIDLLRQQAALASGDEKASLTDQADKDQAALDRLRAELEKMDTSWEQWKTKAGTAIDQVSMKLTTGLNGMITQHERFGQAVARMWNSMVITGLNALERIAAQWIAHHLRMLLIKQTTNTAGVVSDATAATASDAIEKTSSIRTIFASAKAAAAKTYKAYAEFPPLAAVLAAATFAGVMALAAFREGGAVDSSAHSPRLLGFDTGGSIARSISGSVRGPGSGTSDSILARLSNGEHVITERASSIVGRDNLDAINRNPEGMAAMMNGAFLPPIRQSAPYSQFGMRLASGAVDPGVSRGGDTQHYSFPTHIDNLSALDGASVRAALEEHGDLIGKIAVTAVKRHYRTGGSR